MQKPEEGEVKKSDGSAAKSCQGGRSDGLAPSRPRRKGSGLEKRQVYRVPGQQLRGGTVAIVLETAEGARFDAEILDLSIKGVGARFQGHPLPDLDLRDDVTIEVLVSGEQPWRLPAIMRSAFKTPNWSRYGFEFVGDKAQTGGFASRIYHWFNRRSSPRAEPDAERPIEVFFEQPGEELTKGRLTNISSGGAAVEVQGGEACTLAVGDATTIRLAFEEGADLLSLSAEIRRCELSGKQATIGLRFTGPFDQDVMDQVSSYVLERLASEF